jgi:hypothetical protein
MTLPCSLAHDTLFPTFLNHLIDALLRQPLPLSTESHIPPLQLKALSLLTYLCLNHPTLLSTIAASLPLDYIIPVLLEQNLLDDALINPQVDYFLPIFQFLASVSMSSSVTIASTKSLRMLHAACVSAMGSAQLCSWAVAAFAGFSRNSATFSSFIKLLPTLFSLKRDLAALLSSQEHSLVVAALSAIASLFVRGVDKDTAMRVSIAAIISPPELPVATALAAAVVLQFADQVPLDYHNVERLLKAAATSRGMRSFIIHKLLLECGGAVHDNLVRLLQIETQFTQFIGGVLSSEQGFVTVAGTHLLITLFESNSIPVEIEITEPFLAALSHILQNNSDDLDRSEAMLLIIRFLIQPRESMTQVIRVLHDQEENLFISFQRHIELNHLFLVLHFSWCFTAQPISLSTGLSGSAKLSSIRSSPLYWRMSSTRPRIGGPFTTRCRSCTLSCAGSNRRRPTPTVPSRIRFSAAIALAIHACDVTMKCGPNPALKESRSTDPKITRFRRMSPRVRRYHDSVRRETSAERPANRFLNWVDVTVTKYAAESTWRGMIGKLSILQLTSLPRGCGMTRFSDLERMFSDVFSKFNSYFW